MRKHLYFLCMLLLTTACEYPITENYIEISKPEPEITVSMDLNAFVNANTILVTQSTQLDYSLSLSGKEVKKIIFSLGDKTWESTSANGSIFINESLFPSGEYTLKAKFYAPTGSGSIADQLEAEAYTGEMSWPLIIDYTTHMPNLVSYRTTQSGTFELNWQVPQYNHLQLKSYTVDVQGVDFYSTTIPANQTYFRDGRQVGNAATYRIFANLRYEDKQDLTWYIGSLEMPDQNKLYVAKWDLENVYLRWETPYACQIHFSINDGSPFIPSAEDEYLTVPVSNFGSDAWWDLNKVVMSLSSPEHPSDVIYRKEINAGSPGVHFKNERGNSWCYNPLTQLLYSIDSEECNVYKYPDTTSLYTLPTNNHYDIISSRTEPLVALCVSRQKIEIRDAYSLALKYTINEPLLYLDSQKKEQCLVFTPDGNLMYQRWYGNILQVVTCEMDGTTISTLNVEGNPILISHDGNYIAYSNNFGMKVIELKNHQPINEYTLPIPYERQLYTSFNPANSSQLIVPNNLHNSIEIRNCKNYELIREVQFADKMNFRLADPITGNILVNDEHSLAVLSATNEQTLLTMKAPRSIYPVLLGNHLISYDGYIINIEKTTSK